MLLTQHKSQPLIITTNHITPLRDTRLKLSRALIPFLKHWEFPLFWWKDNGFFLHDAKSNQDTHLDLGFTHQDQTYMPVLYTLTFIPDILPGIIIKPTTLFKPHHVQQLLLK